MRDGFAYVTSREEGLFIIDVRNPEEMVIVAHHDTLELGTGVAVSGTLASVANRQYGVEFLDISNPGKPSFLGSIRTGEAQSVFIRDTLAFVGDWAPREIVICNISNPREPKIIAKVELDGFGDGVFVRDNLCFAATGHHARGVSSRDTESPLFGSGHGLEIIDISDPYNPETLSTIKLPVKFYQRYIDMWDVQVSGDYAFICDSEAGVFVINISDPRNPFFDSHVLLPSAQMPEYMTSTFKEGNKGGPVGGFAIGDGVIYVAGKLDDLYVVDAKTVASPVDHQRFVYSDFLNITEDSGKLPWVYSPDGQVHSVFAIEGEKNKVLIAAGEAGVHEVEVAPRIKGRQILNTGTIVFDVSYSNELLFVAEGVDGCSVWQHEDANFRLMGRYHSAKGGIYQMQIDSERKYAILHAGQNTLEFVDISDPTSMKLIHDDQQFAGNMYRLPLATGMLQNRYVGSSWHRPGAFLYDVGSKNIKDMGQLFPALGIVNGLAFFNGKALAIYGGGYLISDPTVEAGLDDVQPITIENVRLEGKPTIFGSSLYMANRIKGIITAVNIKNLDAPKLTWQIEVKGNPGLVAEIGRMVLVPAGRGGLQLFNSKSGKPFYRD